MAVAALPINSSLVTNKPHYYPHLQFHPKPKLSIIRIRSEIPSTSTSSTSTSTSTSTSSNTNTSPPTDEPPKKPISPGLGFGSSSSSSTSSSKPNSSSEKSKEKRKGSRRDPRAAIIRRRTPIDTPQFGSEQQSGGNQPTKEQSTNEGAFVLTWLGLGIVILVQGIALAASGFLPEEWDKLFVKYLYPSFTPTVGLFVAGSVAYGVLKYLQNEELKGKK